jgi:anti-sigma factor RsiW
MKITYDILQAFVDGKLDAAQHQEVGDWLAQNPEKAAEVADWQAQNDSIHALFPAPETRLDVAELARLSIPARPPAPPLMARLAAALAVLALGLSLGWYSRGELPSGNNAGDSMVQQALAAHAVFAADANRPVEIRGTEEALLLRWLSNRLGESLAAPDLRVQGYELVGGRLLSVPDGPAALFMYENASGNRITLFATRAGADSQMAEFRFESSDTARGFYWQDSRLAYAVIGDLSRKSLSALATVIYKQLS